MYYKDYLIDELKILDYIFSQEIETNEAWHKQIETILQENNIYDYISLSINTLEFLINYGKEIAFKYNINLTEKIGELI